MHKSNSKSESGRACPHHLESDINSDSCSDANSSELLFEHAGLRRPMFTNRIREPYSESGSTHGWKIGIIERLKSLESWSSNRYGHVASGLREWKSSRGSLISTQWNRFSRLVDSISTKDELCGLARLVTFSASACSLVLVFRGIDVLILGDVVGGVISFALAAFLLFCVHQGIGWSGGDSPLADLSYPRTRKSKAYLTFFITLCSTFCFTQLIAAVVSTGALIQLRSIKTPRQPQLFGVLILEFLLGTSSAVLWGVTAFLGIKLTKMFKSQEGPLIRHSEPDRFHVEIDVESKGGDPEPNTKPEGEQIAS